MEHPSASSVFARIPPENQHEALAALRDLLSVLIVILERLHEDPVAFEEFSTLTGLKCDPKLKTPNLDQAGSLPSRET